MVTGEPGLTVPLASLTLMPDGAETLNEAGPLTELRVNEPVKNPKPDRNICTVRGDALRTGRGGAGFGFGGGVRGGAGRAGADDAAGWLRAGADGRAGGADEAGVTAALDLIRSVADNASTILVIGHNPTMSALSYRLDDSRVRPAGGLRTSGIAVHRVNTSWADLATAPMTAEHTPRG